MTTVPRHGRLAPMTAKVALFSHRRSRSNSKIPVTAGNGKKSSSMSEVAMCSNVNAVDTRNECAFEYKRQ